MRRESVVSWSGAIRVVGSGVVVGAASAAAFVVAAAGLGVTGVVCVVVGN
jgi:hypothetical protein